MKLIKLVKKNKKNSLNQNHLHKIFCVKNNIFINKLIYFFIFILFIYFNFQFLIYSQLYKQDNLKVCLCTIGKKENKYVREFISHYKQYSVDKIFIYDNNDLGDEKFETVILDYINNKLVEIINVRGKIKAQKKVLIDCYKTNKKIYDWLIILDMDEFIFLKNFGSIKTFLSDKRFLKCNIIYLNRVFHTDNNQIYYKNISLFKRFPKYTTNVTSVKSILRGRGFNIKFENIHIINFNCTACNGFGNFINKSEKLTDFKYFYFNHFYFKSTEEYIEKINRGDARFGINKKIKLKKLQTYFLYNKITIEKIKLFEQKTGINLDFYKKKIKM